VPPAAAKATEELPTIAANGNGALVTWLEQAYSSTVTASKGMPIYLSGP
jgi:hypothetical protein